MGRFGAFPHAESTGYFGTSTKPEPAKRPAFNNVIFGAVIAHVRCNPKDSGKASGTAATWTQSHATRLAAFSPTLRIIDLQRYGSWRSFQQPLLRRLEIQNALTFTPR
jgi:hypothetical protein